MRIPNVKQIIDPSLDREAIRNIGQTHTPVHYDEAVLLLAEEQVGAGVVITSHTSVHEDQAFEPTVADWRRPRKRRCCHDLWCILQVVAWQQA